ncbi:hypothetical protein N7510_004438 [Penicillium lagena]|uniref:uncharacterized protein n=1 Tax=Penicillium lagena TaxID=94218 RepID=UPI0025416B1C|nr:uncharacterized protein N7510_004438 [Penicillium lagena]KAJ5620454.1 hypothetical protein N7510_004438 [Penicillium lagena]
MSSRIMCSQWPPAPCVEDEPDSLARELDGLANMGDKPGLEGACTRGNVDQIPVIMTPNMASSSSFCSFTSVPNVPGPGSNVSSDDSSGPITPPATHDPVFDATAGSRLDGCPQRAPSSSSSRIRGRASQPEVFQKPLCELNTPWPSRPPSLSRGNNYNGVSVESTSHDSHGMEGPGHSRPRGPVYSKHPVKPVNVSTLADRMEEKLKLRQKQRESVPISNPESRKHTTKGESLNTGVGSSVPTSAPHSPSPKPRAAPSTRSYHEQLPPTCKSHFETPKSGQVTIPAYAKEWLKPNLAQQESCCHSATLQRLRTMSRSVSSCHANYFVPSQPKPASQKTRCTFSNPWTRLAWTQMIKNHHDSLEMLYQMTRPPPGAWPCPGRTATEQTWHRIIDPETGSYLPPLLHVWRLCPQQHSCDLVTSSPRFIRFIDLLDAAATRAEASHLPRPDTRELIAYARRKVALRDCRRDRPVFSTWHYIAALPELSVCEDCYDEVIWPLVRARHRIARLFCPSLHLLPGEGPNHCRRASCQMYSPRMRAWFRDAVVQDDFATLCSVALRRFDAERRFHHRRDELLEAEARGYHVSDEMRKAVEEWRRWE